MNLSHLKLEKEDEQAFHVLDSRDGKSFRVAKRGLGEDTLAQVTQHFAKEGEDAPDPLAPQLLVPESAPSNALSRAKLLMRQAETPAPSPTPAGPVAAPSVASLLAPVDAPTVLNPEAAPQAGEPPPPVQAPPPGLGAQAQGAGGMDKAYADAVKAAQAKADVERERAAEDAVKAAERAQREQQLAQRMDTQFQQNEARVQAAQKDVESGKVNPNDWWNNASKGGGLGRKVMASIALLLGGLGGNQQAIFDVINRSIENDIDAQKADLGKKKTMLDHYVQQGHDIQTAKRLAISDLQSLYASQLEANRAKYAPKEIGANLQAAVADIKAKAASGRQAAYQQKFQNDVALSHLLNERAEIEAKRKPMGGLLAPGWAAGAIEVSPEQKAKLQEKVAATTEISGAIDELTKTMDETGWWRTKVLPTDAKHTMSAQANAIQLRLKKEADAGKFSPEVVRRIDELAPDPTHGFTPEWIAGEGTKLQQLKRILQSEVAAHASALGARRVEGGTRSRDEQIEAKLKARGG